MPGTSETRSGSRSALRLLLEMDDAPLTVHLQDAEGVGLLRRPTGITATVASATWRRCVSSIRR